MSSQPQPIADLDYDVAAYLELTEKVEELNSQREAIKARLAQRGLGEHVTTTGTVVAVTPPNRSFDLDRAVGFLTDQQREVCRVDGFDAKKVKTQLAEVVLDQCWNEGKGAPRVTIK